MRHWAVLLGVGASVGIRGRKNLSRTCWPGLGFFRREAVDTWDLLGRCLEAKEGTEGDSDEYSAFTSIPGHWSSSDSGLKAPNLSPESTSSISSLNGSPR